MRNVFAIVKKKHFGRNHYLRILKEPLRWMAGLETQQGGQIEGNKDV
jgi:hypothetical protein